MNFTEQEYLALLRESLPGKFLKALLNSVFVAHQAAADHLRSAFEVPERHNLSGHVRRAKLNEEIKGLGDRHGVDVAWRPYGRGSGYYLLVSRGRIALIVCVLRSRRCMVRDAEYRKLLARYNDNAQQKFSFMPPSATDEGSKHLCILIHGRRKGKNQPAFADIAFPHKSFEQWICRLNLFQEFPELVVNWVIGPTTHIEPKQPRIRKQSRTA